MEVNGVKPVSTKDRNICSLTLGFFIEATHAISSKRTSPMTKGKG